MVEGLEKELQRLGNKRYEAQRNFSETGKDRCFKILNRFKIHFKYNKQHLVHNRVLRCIFLKVELINSSYEV
jgi:hypothetical protein